MTYLTDEQVGLLLRPIHPKRVLQRDGMSYVEGYDIRAEMNRVFGFGRWSAEVLEQALICETEVKTRGGKDAWYVVYRTRLRLTVNAPDGTYLTCYDGSHVGESTHPVRGEAHGNALTNSETYALRRAAINLGDQFGLSLYNKGSLEPCVRWTLVRPDAGAPKADTEDVPQVNAEEPGAASGGSEQGHSAGTVFDSAEPADQEHITPPRDVSEPELADEARAAIAGRRARSEPPDGTQWERPWLDWALDEAFALKTEQAAGELWRESAAKAHNHEITREDAKKIQDRLNARVADIRKFDQALKRLGDSQWADRIRDIADEDEARRVLADASGDKAIPVAKGHLIRDAILTAWPGAADDESGAAA